jgi:hypothetical protein
MYLQGQLAVVGSILADNGPQIPIFLPADYAHTLGCAPIELAVLAKDREPDLRRTGQLLDMNTLTPEFGSKLKARLRLNGSEASIST